MKDAVLLHRVGISYVDELAAAARCADWSDIRIPETHDNTCESA